MPERTCIRPDCYRAATDRDWCHSHYNGGIRKGSIKPLPKRTTIERFWSKVEKRGKDECWNWLGAIGNGTGYGQIRGADGRTTNAHRWIYEQTKGRIAGNLLVDHICHNRACVNVAHMRLVTKKQNAENVTGANSSSTTGVLGVHRYSRINGYRGQVAHHGVKHFTPGRATIAEVEADVVALRLRLFTHNDHDRVGVHG